MQTLVTFVPHLADLEHVPSEESNSFSLHFAPVPDFVQTLQAEIQALEQGGHMIVAIIPVTEGFAALEPRGEVRNRLDRMMPIGGYGGGMSFTTGFLIHSTIEQPAI